MAKILAGLLFGVVLCASVTQAQSGSERRNELALWIGGGYGSNGSTSGTGLWNAGARYGWGLTGPHGPGILRGRLEYAVDVVPIFWVFQKSGTAYGFGLNPFALKWNFETHHRVAPYIEFGSGTLFTNRKVPEGTSRVNFTTSGALGMHFLRGKRNWNAEVRFMHLSNAGLTTPNPGINTIQVRLGFGLSTKKD